MSDRFNQQEPKRRILQILKLDPKSSTLPVENYFPAFFRPEMPFPKQGDYVKWLTEFGVTTYKPQAIPDDIDQDAHGLLNPGLDPLLDEVSSRLTLPWGDGEYLPKYTPHHFSNNYDKKLLKQIVYFWLEDPHTQDFDDLVTDCVKTAEEKAFCTGSYRGQISRLKGVYDIAKGSNGKKKPVSVFRMLPEAVVKEYPGNRYEAVCAVMRKYLPLNRAYRYQNPGGPVYPAEGEEATPFDNDFPGLYDPPSYFVNSETGMDFLPPIGYNKMFGLPFIGKTKGERVLEALVLSDSLFEGLAAVIKSTPFEANNYKQGYRVPQIYANEQKPEDNKLKQLMQDFWWMGAGPLFPKAERYVQREIFDKTRNIYAASYPLHIICGLVSNAVVRFSPNCLDVWETPSLYAFSPWHGNLNKLIAHMLKERKTTSFVYADNWYIAYWENDKMTWYSLDQEKAEAQLQYDDVRALAYYLLTNGHISEDGKPMFGLTWFYLAMNILPAFLHDPIGLVKNFQFKIPGMGSGVGWTFLLNHIRTSVLDAKWRSMGMPKPGTPDFEAKILIGQSANLKIELEVPDFEAKLQEAKANTIPNGIMQQLDPYTDAPPDKPVPSVRMDLLGWSAAYSHALDEWVPVLDDERFLASLILPVKDENYKYKDEPWAPYEYTLAAKTAMLMVGGWRYAPVYKALQNLITEARLKLTKLHHDSEAELREAFSRTEFAAELDLPPELKLTKPLTNADYILLHLPKEKGGDRSEYVKTWVERLGVDIQHLGMGVSGGQTTVPGATFMANLRIEDYLANKGLLGRTLTSNELKEFYLSREFQEALAERQSLANWMRSQAEMPSIRPVREKDVQRLADPFLSYRMHHLEMTHADPNPSTGFTGHEGLGYTAHKLGAGPQNIGLDQKLSKGQRKRRNRAHGKLLVESLIEDKAIPLTLVDLNLRKGQLDERSLLIAKMRAEKAAEDARLGRNTMVDAPLLGAGVAGVTGNIAGVTTVTEAREKARKERLPEKPQYTYTGGSSAWTKSVVIPPKLKEIKTSEFSDLNTEEKAKFLTHFYVKFGKTPRYSTYVKSLEEEDLKDVRDLIIDDHGPIAAEELLKE